MLKIAYVAVAVAFAGDAFATTCSNEFAVWEAKFEGNRFVLSINEGPAWGWRARIEQWRGTSRAWHLETEIRCTQGHVICELLVPNLLRSDNPENNVTSAIVEWIDADGNALSDWIVLAALQQKLWYAGGADVEWATGFVPDERVQIPNVFRLFECRDRGILGQGSNRPGGAVFGIPSACSALEADGSLDPQFHPTPLNDGLWWMDNQRMVGWEYDCKVQQWNAGWTVSLQCNGLDEEWEEVRTVREIGTSRFVDEERLERCDR